MRPQPCIARRKNLTVRSFAHTKNYLSCSSRCIPRTLALEPVVICQAMCWRRSWQSQTKGSKAQQSISCHVSRSIGGEECRQASLTKPISRLMRPERSALRYLLSYRYSLGSRHLCRNSRDARVAATPRSAAGFRESGGRFRCAS
jgi:hypothetical protein